MNRVRHFFLHNTELLLYIVCWLFHASAALTANHYGYKPLSAYNISVSFVYATFVLLFANISTRNIFFTFFYFEMLVYSIVLTISTGTDFGASIVSVSVVPLLFLATINQQHRKRYFISRIFCASAVTLFILWWAYARTGMLSLDFVTALTIHRHFYITHFIQVLTIMVIFLFYYSILTENAVLRSRRKADNQLGTLSHMATHDQLTGLMNRRKFATFLHRAQDTYEKAGADFTFTIFDIDGFKQINDTYGHDVGDFVLKNMTAFVSQQLPATVQLARWGGEEFVLLFPESQAAVRSQLESIRKNVATHVFRWQYTDITITLTFGVCSLSEARDTEKMIVTADNRLMYGKKHGKNQIVDTTARGEDAQ